MQWYERESPRQSIGEGFLSWLLRFLCSWQIAHYRNCKQQRGLSQTRKTTFPYVGCLSGLMTHFPGNGTSTKYTKYILTYTVCMMCLDLRFSCCFQTKFSNLLRNRFGPFQSPVRRDRVIVCTVVAVRHILYKPSLKTTLCWPQAGLCHLSALTN